MRNQTACQRKSLYVNFKDLGWDARAMVGEMLQAGLVDSLSGDDVAYLKALVDDFPITA